MKRFISIFGLMALIAMIARTWGVARKFVSKENPINAKETT